jgi:two-component system chemotaxis response regulator CheY
VRSADIDRSSDQQRRHVSQMLPAERVPARLGPPRSTPPVLIAEDEEPIAEVLALIVESMGHTPLLAAHGKQALELARQQRPALVITDLMMPQMDGVALIAALRADAAAQDRAAPPIIAMTAAGARRARDAGADAVLSKPFDLDELETLLRRFL